MSNLVTTETTPTPTSTKTIATPVSTFESCDACGAASVKGTYTATLINGEGVKSLNFCGHHIRSFATKLRNDGFHITPEDISYNAEL